MADDTRRIVIEIMSSESGGGGGGDNDDKDKTKKEKTKQEKERERLRKMIQSRALSTAKNITLKAIEATSSHYIRMKEDYMLENSMNIFKTTVTKGLGIAATLKMGAAAGLPGLAIAATGLVVNEAIQFSTRWRDTYANINESNYNKVFNRARLGLTDNGRGTEN